MIAQQRGLLTAATLVSLAIFRVYLQARDTQADDARDTSSPDFYITAPDWRQFDSNGRLVRQLTAERLEKWPGESQGQLTEPRLILNREDAGRWEASARHGLLSVEPQELVLQQQVELARQSDTNAAVISTTQLRISGKHNRIETDQPVVLQSGSWHVTAIGLRAGPGRQQLELLENVRGRHD